MEKLRHSDHERTNDRSEVVLRAFSVEHAARITGLSKARLTRWDRLGFFSPEHADEEDRGNPYGRVYSFNDLVGLRTLAVLTDQHHVKLEELRRAHDGLIERSNRPWSDIPLSVCKGQVVFDLDNEPRNASDGQKVLKHVPLPRIADEVAERAAALRKRDKAQVGVIEQHKFIAHNARVLAGTRIPVSAVESFINAGFSDDAIVEEYPTLTTFDVSTVRRQMKTAA